MFTIGSVYRGWSLQRPAVYGVLGSGMLGFAALQVLLAAEACVAVYTVFQRTLASASSGMFEAVSTICVRYAGCPIHLITEHAS